MPSDLKTGSSTPSDDSWRPTPSDRLIRARMVDGTMVDYRDLKPGNIFQAISVEGLPIYPFDEELDDETWCLCEGAPVMNDGSVAVWGMAEGFNVPILTGTLAELRVKGN